jgi:hypothetical protein
VTRKLSKLSLCVFRAPLHLALLPAVIILGLILAPALFLNEEMEPVQNQLVVEDEPTVEK